MAVFSCYNIFLWWGLLSSSLVFQEQFDFLFPWLHNLNFTSLCYKEMVVNLCVMKYQQIKCSSPSLKYAKINNFVYKNKKLVFYMVNKVNNQPQDKFYKHSHQSKLHQLIHFFLIVTSFTDQSSTSLKLFEPCFTRLNVTLYERKPASMCKPIYMQVLWSTIFSDPFRCDKM